VNPIHPSLAPLARAAKKKSWNELGAALQAAVHKPAWLRPEHRVGDPAAYMRHVLYVDAAGDFVITAITWLPGQISPVHGHQVWCMFGVAEGELTEEQFSASSLKISGNSIYRPGDIADADLECTRVHRVSNRASTTLVSLHLYGVAAEKLTTGINRPYKL
jgi:predicted metal-dependent enzyme (double-stranded beta helix superfamily)